MSSALPGDRFASQAIEPSRFDSRAQQNIDDRTQTLLTDKEKWQRSKQRWNPDIKPADKSFTTTYTYFLEELKRKSPEAVVKKDFSNHEVRKFLNGYVNKKRFKAINVLQAYEKKHYIGLLKSADYHDVKAHSSPLALKLTMMYFGLPVAPMAFTDPLQGSGESPFGNLVFSSSLNEDEDEFNDEDLSFVPEELRPLRFLNYYDKRGHGKDNVHSQSFLSIGNISRSIADLNTCSEPRESLRAVLRNSHGGAYSRIDDSDAPPWRRFP